MSNLQRNNQEEIFLNEAVENALKEVISRALEIYLRSDEFYELLLKEGTKEIQEAFAYLRELEKGKNEGRIPERINTLGFERIMTRKESEGSENCGRYLG